MSRDSRLRLTVVDHAVEIVGGYFLLRETGRNPRTLERPCKEVRAVLDEDRGTLTLWIETTRGPRSFSLALRGRAQLATARRIATHLRAGAAPAHAPDIVGNDGGTRVIAGARRRDAPPPLREARRRKAPPRKAPPREVPPHKEAPRETAPREAPPREAPPSAKPERAADRLPPPETKHAADRPSAVDAEPAPAEAEPIPTPAAPEPEPPPAPPFAGIDLPMPDDGDDWIVFEPLPGTLRLIAPPSG